MVDRALRRAMFLFPAFGGIFQPRGAERSIHLVKFLHPGPERLETRVEIAAEENIEVLVDA
jgi:hypothetical protein